MNAALPDDDDSLSPADWLRKYVAPNLEPSDLARLTPAAPPAPPPLPPLPPLPPILPSGVLSPSALGVPPSVPPPAAPAKSADFLLPPAGFTASYAWCSSLQLLVAKGGRQITLDRADLAVLRTFLARFDTDPTAEGA